MASYTSHYNLKKPAGSEKVQIGDINGNMDTLDTELYSTNQALSALNSKLQNKLGTFNSLSELESALNTLNSGLKDLDVVPISFNCSSNVETPFANAAFCGMFTRSTATRARVMIMRSGWYHVIEGYLGNDGWVWDTLALKSEVLKWEQVSITAPPTGTLTVYKNTALRLGFLSWVGGGSTPTADSYSFNVPTGARPVTNVYTDMRDGEYINVATSGAAQIVFGSARKTYTVASMVYPLSA